MIREAIAKVAKGENLSYEMAEGVMDEIMRGEASQIQMAAFLTAMSLKGETIEEITASAAGMRRHCIRLLHEMDVLEIVGTGGDQSNSFNISTTSALVVSAAGVPVAKHGNRAASSKRGAADVLEALGVNITIPPEHSKKILEQIGRIADGVIVGSAIVRIVEQYGEAAGEPVYQYVRTMKEAVRRAEQG